MRQSKSGAARVNQAASPAQPGGRNRLGRSQMKTKRRLVVSPFAEAKYVYLNRPDTRFDPEKGIFSVHQRTNPENEAHAAFLKSIEDIARQEVGEGATAPIRDDKDSYGNFTGMKLVKFASRYPPKIFDMGKNPLDAEIGSGSIIRVSALVNVYKNKGGKSGVNLYLQSVQVKELADPFGSDASVFPDDTDAAAGSEMPAEEEATEVSHAETELPF